MYFKIRKKIILFVDIIAKFENHSNYKIKIFNKCKN